MRRSIARSGVGVVILPELMEVCGHWDLVPGIHSFTTFFSFHSIFLNLYRISGEPEVLGGALDGFRLGCSRS